MVKLIVAKASNNVIGKDNDLIWHLPADMRFFTQSTKGHIVIMGRRNWDSIPDKYRPLSDRINVVITRNTDFSHPDCVVFHTLEEAIEFYLNNEPEKDVFVIGGGQVYQYALKHQLVDQMLITYIHEFFEGDTYFPEFNESEWDKTLVMDYKSDEKNPHDFTVYQFDKNKF